TLTPTSWTTSARRGGIGTLQLFTLRNTSPTVTLTNIGIGTLSGSGDFSILTANCGATGLIQHPTLAPNATCTISVRLVPKSSDAAGSVQTATLPVPDSAGTQSSSLSGTAQ